MGAFVGFVLALTIYLVMWLAPYVRDFPLYVGILLDALIPWIVGRFGFALSLLIISIPTIVGGVVGLLLTRNPQSLESNQQIS